MMDDNKLPTSVDVSLILTGENDFIESFSKLVGLRPTDSFIKGSSFLSVFGGYKTRKLSSWEYKMPFSSLDFEVYTNELIYLFGGVSNEIREFSKQNNLEVCLSVYCVIRNGEAPGSHFDSKLLNFLSAIGASIDFDLYVESAKYYEPIDGFERLT